MICCIVFLIQPGAERSNDFIQIPCPDNGNHIILLKNSFDRFRPQLPVFLIQQKSFRPDGTDQIGRIIFSALSPRCKNRCNLYQIRPLLQYCGKFVEISFQPGITVGLKNHNRTPERVHFTDCLQSSPQFGGVVGIIFDHPDLF